jgi:hypothetical protein
MSGSVFRALLHFHAAFHTTMFPKRLIALILFTALAAMHAGGLRAQWVQTK